ncbi:MAG: hypothetical protein OXH06_13205 [Gemmatimonadetes bacterium]|nr:hypothetical protein [Gemmatimonadota bacterium]
MTDQILATSAQASVACAQLPGRETGLASREMTNTPGGFSLPTGPSFMVLFISKKIAEAIVDYFDDED